MYDNDREKSEYYWNKDLELNNIDYSVEYRLEISSELNEEAMNESMYENISARWDDEKDDYIDWDEYNEEEDGSRERYEENMKDCFEEESLQYYEFCDHEYLYEVNIEIDEIIVNDVNIKDYLKESDCNDVFSFNECMGSSVDSKEYYDLDEYKKALVDKYVERIENVIKIFFRIEKDFILETQKLSVDDKNNLDEELEEIEDGIDFYDYY